jgi:hypothetical protein
MEKVLLSLVKSVEMSVDSNSFVFEVVGLGLFMAKSDDLLNSSFDVGAFQRFQVENKFEQLSKLFLRVTHQIFIPDNVSRDFHSVSLLDDSCEELLHDADAESDPLVPLLRESLMVFILGHQSLTCGVPHRELRRDRVQGVPHNYDSFVSQKSLVLQSGVRVVRLGDPNGIIGDLLASKALHLEIYS